MTRADALGHCTPKSARGLMKQVWDARLLGNHNSNKTPKRLPTLHSTTSHLVFPSRLRFRVKLRLVLWMLLLE
jgi:hypothetical protein